jgi:hypothetical protein
VPRVLEERHRRHVSASSICAAVTGAAGGADLVQDLVAVGGAFSGSTPLLVNSLRVCTSTRRPSVSCRRTIFTQA